MKIVITFAAILAVIIGFWMWSHESPATTLSGEGVALEVVVSSSDERVLSSTTSQPESALEPTRAQSSSAPTSTERLNVAKAIVRDLRGQQLLRTLREDPRLDGLEAEVLLALIEDGSIDINESLAGIRSPIREFTPILVALLVTERKLSVANFDRFIERGARVENDGIWQVMMSGVKDKALIERWYQSANAGPEQHQEMFNQALMAGNSVFIDFILEEKGGKFDRLSFTGNQTERVKKQLIGHDKDEFKRVVTLRNEARQEHRADVEKMIDNVYELRLRQIDLLLSYADLSSEEKKEIVAARNVLKSEIKELEKLFASEVE